MEERFSVGEGSDVAAGERSAERLARFFYERGRSELVTGVPWEDLKATERDSMRDMVRPLVPVVERCAAQVRAMGASLS